MPPKPETGVGGHRHIASIHTNGNKTARDTKITSRRTSNNLSYDGIKSGSNNNSRLNFAGQKVELVKTRLLSKSP